MMSCKTSSAGFPCLRRNPLLQHHPCRVPRAHWGLRHTNHPRLSMMAGRLSGAHLDLLRRKRSPQTKSPLTFTMVTAISPRSSKRPRATPPSATLASVLKSRPILLCSSKTPLQVSRLYLNPTGWSQTPTPREATEEHPMPIVHHPLHHPISKALTINGERLGGSHPSVALTPIKPGARKTHQGLNLTRQLPAALLSLRQNLLQP